MVNVTHWINFTKQPSLHSGLDNSSGLREGSGQLAADRWCQGRWDHPTRVSHCEDVEGCIRERAVKAGHLSFHLIDVPVDSCIECKLICAFSLSARCWGKYVSFKLLWPNTDQSSNPGMFLRYAHMASVLHAVILVCVGLKAEDSGIASILWRFSSKALNICWCPQFTCSALKWEENLSNTLIAKKPPE